MTDLLPAITALAGVSVGALATMAIEARRERYQDRTRFAEHRLQACLRFGRAVEQYRNDMTELVTHEGLTALGKLEYVGTPPAHPDPNPMGRAHDDLVVLAPEGIRKAGRQLYEAALKLENHSRYSFERIGRPLDLHAWNRDRQAVEAAQESFAATVRTAIGAG